MGSDQPSFETLIAYVLGELDPTAAEAVRRQVDGPGGSAAMLARIRTLFDTMRADDSVLPPRAVVDRARDLIGAAPTRAAASAAAWWARAIESAAALIFDSRAQTATAGFRGAAMGRQLSFRCEQAEIDLAVTEAAGGGWTIMGQVDPAGGEMAGSVALVAPDAAEPDAVATLDATGRFRVQTRLPACDVRLLIGGTVVGLGTVSLE